MTEIIINGPDDLEIIIERLDKMPMTRKFGKGLIARIPVDEVDIPTAIYIRVSSPKQASEGKGSLAEQFHAVWEETIRRNGQPIVVYADVCTAVNRNRLAFNVLIEDLREGKIDMIGCWHSTRLVRTQLAAGELEDAIENLDKKVEMFAITDTLDPDVLGVLAWAGRWERKAFRERSLMGRQAAVADNRPPSGKLPFWIDVVRDETGKPVGYVLKPVAEWIKWAAESYANGIGSTAIAARFNREGVPRATKRTKYGWTRQYIAQILKYPALKGKWGPFWGQFIDVPALIDEATWNQIQERMQENRTSTGRPAKHFVALRGLLYCGVCGLKIGTHVRDWDYTYKLLKDGTKKRYRVKKKNLRIKHVCSGQQLYGRKCRKPEYVHTKVLFPRVWAKLCEALKNKQLLLAGLESQLQALESSDEIEELHNIEKRLDVLHDRELSYSEQRADGLINKTIHHELLMRLREQKRELLQTREVLSQQVKLIEEARQQRETAHSLLAVLPEILIDLSKQDQEQLVMALIARVDVSGENEVSITLRLSPDAIRDLPILHEEASHQPESEQLSDSQPVVSDNSKSQVLVRHGQQMNVARCKRNKDYTPG
jgi:DNA invertase Pin-like site-specific DNA recombinase